MDIREAQPAFNDSGRATAMLAQEGSAVGKGDLIATMDDVCYAAGLSQKRRLLLIMRAALLPSAHALSIVRAGKRVV